MHTFLAIGPGPSNKTLLSRRIPENIKTIGLHRTFIDFKLDYLTLKDPNSIVRHWPDVTAEIVDNLPTLILPFWFKPLDSLALFKERYHMYGGFGSLTVGPNSTPQRYHEYKSILELFRAQDKLIYIPKEKIVSHKYLSKNPNELDILDGAQRFNGKVIIGSGIWPRAGKNAVNRECGFTSHVLPLCHYLGTDLIYYTGFDGRPDRSFRENAQFYERWVSSDWRDHHKIEIFSLMANNSKNKLTPYIHINKALSGKITSWTDIGWKGEKEAVDWSKVFEKYSGPDVDFEHLFEYERLRAEKKAKEEAKIKEEIISVRNRKYSSVYRKNKELQKLNKKRRKL